MSRPFRVLLVGLLLSAAGCGDTPHIIFRDAITLRNEVADVMLKVTDEESAKTVWDTQVGLLKKKWDALKHRAEKVFKDAKPEDTKKSAEMFLWWLDEAMESSNRLASQQFRLDALRRRLYREQRLAEGAKEPIPMPEAALGQSYPNLTQWLKIGAEFPMTGVWSSNPYMAPPRSDGSGGTEPGMMAPPMP